MIDLSAVTREKMARVEAKALGQIPGWKFKFGDIEGGERVDFDDSDWHLVDPGMVWWGEHTYAYFRKTVVIPEQILGGKVEGNKVALKIGVDDDGEVFVNGEKRDTFGWDKGYVVLTENAKPGQQFQVTIRAHNDLGPGKLLFARWDGEFFAPVGERVSALFYGYPYVELHFRQSPEDKGRWERLLTGAVDILDEDALDRGDIPAFHASIDKAVEILQPISYVFKRYKVQLVAQSHIDLAWLWPWSETVDVCKNTYGSALNLMKEFPELIYSQSQAASYLWMEQDFPEIFKEIQDRVKECKWEIVGGQWAECDCNIPNGESHIRQFLYGKRYFKDKFGVDCRIAWLPDTFGFSWTLPQIFKGCGVDYFMTTKMSWNQENQFPYQVFNWQSPDGTQVLSYQPITGLGQSVHPELIWYVTVKHQRNTGQTDSMYIYGIGDHGGGPSRDMCEAANKMEDSVLGPTIIQGTALEWFERIKDHADVPVLNDELYLENHRGTYTSQAKTKENNRRAECRLAAAEKLAAFAFIQGKDYPRADFEEMWRKTLFNQFHDILPGSGIRCVYEDAQKDYDFVFETCDKVQNETLSFLAGKIDTSGAGEPVIIFNPLSWNVTAPIKLADGTNFIAHDVPAMGYKVIDGKKLEKAASKVSVTNKNGDIEISNGKITARINKASGFVSYISDESGVNRLTGLGNFLQAYEEKLPETDAWNIKWGYENDEVEIPAPCSIETIQPSDEIAIIKVKRTFRTSTIEQSYVLRADSEQLDIQNAIDWHEKNVMLKTAFPIQTTADYATYETAYGTIGRSTRFETPVEQARFEVNGQQWVDMSDDNGGLSILNDSKYGYDARKQNMRITLLRCPDNPDPNADEGLHEFTYSLYPHAGALNAEQVTQRARELNNPLIAFTSEPHTGTLPAEHSFAGIEGGGIVEAMKVAEDGGELITRIVEYNGQCGTSFLTVTGAKSAALCNMIEEGSAEVAVENGKAAVELKPYKIETLKIKI